MRFAALSLIMIVIGAATSPAVVYGMSVSGPAHVLDGDTADIAGKRVRLYGIDAPELSQSCADAKRKSWPCGKVARESLEELTAGKTVICTYEEVDATGRLLGSCKVDGRDINETLVSEGHAWAFVRYSDVYTASERKARAAQKGIFAAENVPAWEFRQKRWEGSVAHSGESRPAGCPIKGNVSAKGERIYHMPWDKFYSATRISTAKGERWFCDERDAEKAGWRRAYR